MINLLANILGPVMRLCYHWTQNYGIAIILFTILTKIILFPLSIWVHKNSIKMVHMQPEINRIKAKFFGLGDQIAEEESALYKREKYNPFAGIFPMFVQIILLMGLIEVIYNPLTHILHLDSNLISQLINITGQLTGTDITSSSIQMTVVDTIKNPTYWNSFLQLQGTLHTSDLQIILENIQQTNMNLGGLSLALIPATSRGITIFMPVAAGLSAWLMCMVQNHYNPLQAEQSRWNKIGMMILSVGISLVLGAFVPLGVGFYWILSNLFTIIQQLILNHLIDPKKFIDYKELDDSKKELANLNNIGDREKLFSKNPCVKREKLDYKRFFSIANKHLVFYSEKNGFFKYYKGIIDYLLDHSNVVIHYITSDPEDQVFKLENSNFKVYYIGHKKLITLMMKMDADIVVMTMPDIDNFQIKRSYIRKDIEYIYIPHGMDSLNMTMRTGSVDHYNTIFCVGPHQKEEIEETEKVFHLPHKKLVEWGYSLLDSMREEYSHSEKQQGAKKKIIIAPSWQEDNIMDTCLEEILERLKNCDYEITVRPHPQHVRHCSTKIELLKEHYSTNTNIVIQTDFSSNSTIFEADLMITDWSGIAYEFAYTTCKTSVYKGYKRDKIEMRGDRAEISDFPLYLNTVAGGLDRRDQTIGGFSFVVKIYAVPVVEIIG